MGILITIVAILGLFYIYRRREAHEDLLALKLIGYYILGGFKFIFNSFPIPLGYIIYLFIPKAELNYKAKKLASTFGLAMFFVGVFVPFIQSSIYTRTVKIPISSVNANEINFVDEFNKIENKFDIENKLYVNGFDTFLDENGDVSSISITLIDSSQSQVLAYYIHYYESNKGNLLINREKLSTYMPSFPIEANNFFTKVDMIKSYTNITSKGLHLLGPSSIKATAENIVYTIDYNNNIQRLTSSDDLVEGIILSCMDIVNGDDSNSNRNVSIPVFFILQY